MLRLPKFELAEPSTVTEAVELLATHGDRARLMAGGTDLMPNMKHEIESPEFVIGLWNIPDIKGICETDEDIRVGATTTIHELAENALIAELFPSLQDACQHIAGPQLRRMGTIGGNVCLDTRCVYINQTYFWRQSLGFCLKKDGSVCHVVSGGRRCVAAASNDSGPVLMTLGAKLKFVSKDGDRIVPIDEFYDTDGVFNQKRSRTELLTEIIIPKPQPNTKSSYAKLRTRAAIDYPELGVAVLARLDDNQKIEHVDICVTALGAKPIRIKNLTNLVQGKNLDAESIDKLSEAAFKRCKPLKNIASDPSYRRDMVPVYVKRALSSAAQRSKLRVISG